MPSDPWAISAGVLAERALTARFDADLQYLQLLWTTKALGNAGLLIPGPSEDDLWPIKFPDGTIDFGYVISGNVYDLQELVREINALRWDDSAFADYSYPRAEGMRRKLKGGYDQWGRQRTGSWTLG